MIRQIPSDSRLRNFLLIILTAVVYFVLATVSLRLAYLSSNATAFWPPSGFAFAAILIVGRKIAPGIFLGAFVAYLLEFLTNNTANTFTALLSSALIGTGNAGEALLGYYLLRKMVPGTASHHYFQKVYRILRFVCVTIVMCLVSCFIGSLTIFVTDIIRADQFFTVMFTWWAAVIASMIVSFPLMYQSAKAGFSRGHVAIEEAARDLGASDWNVFWHVTLPMAFPSLLGGAILSFVRALGACANRLDVRGNHDDRCDLPCLDGRLLVPGVPPRSTPHLAGRDVTGY